MGHRLRALRQDRDLTITELATKSGLKRSTLENWEVRGIHSPAHFYPLAKALDVSPAYFLGDDEQTRQSRQIMSELKLRFARHLLMDDMTIQGMVVIRNLSKEIDAVEEMMERGEL